MTGPAVTSVIAAYRAGDFLRQAIASALAQTLTDLEVLVSDDADDPEVRRLTESFLDPRIRYRSNPTRLGPAGNHWAALLAARGRYVAILNHDDLWRPEYLASAVPVLDHTPDAVLVFCDHDVIDPSGRPLPAEADRTAKQWGRDRLTPGLYRPFPDLVARQAIPVAMGCLFRREGIDPTGLPDVGPAYDLWLAFALCRTGGGAYYLTDRLTAWRVHPGQLTATRNEGWTRGALACWQAMADDPAFRPVRRTVQGRLSQTASALGATQLAAGDHDAARSVARLALRSRPANWRAWAVLGLSLLPRGVAKRVTSRRGHHVAGSEAVR
ncbi:MAG: glycosyltransferase [Planctomycetaceae bacterium]|nr:glycosyltransferase [Planctomycetaceae bacterium]MBV8265097.1 glycosyltransferase [Planctomycetaceae bacterium]MBV8313803.1 glycosyltransferase [Planctomycetaceae bacterium]MBV8556900.1 glycosyltransferase [Planctomycetaceae bacterium]